MEIKKNEKNTPGYLRTARTPNFSSVDQFFRFSRLAQSSRAKLISITLGGFWGNSSIVIGRLALIKTALIILGNLGPG